MDDSSHAIRAGFRQARQTPRSRHRDIAEALSISEGELVAAHCGPFDSGESPLKARRLRGEWPQIVAALQALGEVMALTRNESCVHEKVGVYANASVNGHVGLVLGGAIDLRVFYNRWSHGFAVEERLADGVDQGATQRSLQFFDAQGHAIHKVFLKPMSKVAAYFDLIEQFSATQQSTHIGPVTPEPVKPAAPDADIDVAGFRKAWSSMRDTHEFFGLLQKFGVTRTQGLRLADPSFVHPVPAASAHEVLTRAAQEGVSIMVFVGNPGMIQIHAGPVQRVEVMGPWLNVLDPGFNLHLREDHIAKAWLVKKPTSDGLVHSLELFDAAGETIAMFFGERKPGQAERCDWRNLLASLSPEVEACAS
ncbi:MAG: hemin-degrading factor [Burkholderiales bacterium]|nr:hemin-degrading factor [Burkholderiales bacterium]